MSEAKLYIEMRDRKWRYCHIFCFFSIPFCFYKNSTNSQSRSCCSFTTHCSFTRNLLFFHSILDPIKRQDFWVSHTLIQFNSNSNSFIFPVRKLCLRSRKFIHTRSTTDSPLCKQHKDKGIATLLNKNRTILKGHMWLIVLNRS